MAPLHLATFRCSACGHRWEARPGPQECPKCGSLYLTWENFDQGYQKGWWGNSPEPKVL